MGRPAVGLAPDRRQAARLRESLEHDRSVIARWENTIANFRPGPRNYEIRSSLVNKISEVGDRVASIWRRLHHLEQAIADIRFKLAASCTGASPAIHRSS